MPDKAFHTQRDGRHGVKALLTFWALALLFTGTNPLAAQTDETVHGLRQAGWIVVEKTDRDDWLPGVAPYEARGRLVYVVTYTLQKDGKTMICTVARDTMQDTLKQSCKAAK